MCIRDTLGTARDAYAIGEKGALLDVAEVLESLFESLAGGGAGEAARAGSGVVLLLDARRGICLDAWRGICLNAR